MVFYLKLTLFFFSSLHINIENINNYDGTIMGANLNLLMQSWLVTAKFFTDARLWLNAIKFVNDLLRQVCSLAVIF